MKTPLKPARLGARCRKDPGVFLNACPGRTLAKLQPLKLGADARLRSGTVLYAHSTIGAHFATGHHVVVREENTIGDHVSVWNNTTIDYGCRIADGVKIHCNCYVAQFSVLEEDVFLAPGVTFANDLYPKARGAEKVMQGPIIRRGAVVGVNCTILPSVEIGAGALIGAGSVVTRDVPAGAVYHGNPARLYKMRADLKWPQNLRLLDKESQAFYRQLAGRAAF